MKVRIQEEENEGGKKNFNTFHFGIFTLLSINLQKTTKKYVIILPIPNTPLLN